jgi:GH24 family phage-related lysozyme (muramidase)
MDERRRRQQTRRELSPRRRRTVHAHVQKRKLALALSAGVVGLSTAAMGAVPTEPASATGQLDNPLTRLPARNLHASEELKRALVQEEGVRDTVYRDVGGLPTVGCGHLVTHADGLKVGDRVSSDKILDFLDSDLREAEQSVIDMAGDLPLYQHEFDALVDLVYNVGPGALTAKKSPRLVEAIAAADYTRMGTELQYRYAAGQMARGLAFRSDRRTRMFMAASYADPRAGPTSVPATMLAGGPATAAIPTPAAAVRI